MVLFSENSIHSITLIENTNIIYSILTIHTGTVHYSYQCQKKIIF
jgi:hypothetical protein